MHKSLSRLRKGFFNGINSGEKRISLAMERKSGFIERISPFIERI